MISGERKEVAARNRAVIPVCVWDPIVRLFHWTVVIACAINLFAITDGGVAHRTIGYIAAGFLMVRLIWGSSPRTATPGSLISCQTRFASGPIWPNSFKVGSGAT